MALELIADQSVGVFCENCSNSQGGVPSAVATIARPLFRMAPAGAELFLGEKMNSTESIRDLHG
jgi:hypothetical protein